MRSCGLRDSNSRTGWGNGDGLVATVDAKGVPVDGPAIPQPGTRLDAPKGLALQDGRLYLADIDRVVAFDPATGQQTAEFRPEGAKGLNDLAVAGAGCLSRSLTPAGCWR